LSREEFAKLLLDETREEISRADTKANILLAGAGIVTAVAAAGFTGSHWTLARERGVVQTLAVAALALGLVGVFMLGAAVFPRVGRPSVGRARYFMDHAQYRTISALREALERESDDAADRHLHQLHDLSVIVKRKYRLTQVGELASAFGVGLGVTAGVAHHILRL
jgi:hypothetical protein